MVVENNGCFNQWLIICKKKLMYKNFFEAVTKNGDDKFWYL